MREKDRLMIPLKKIETWLNEAQYRLLKKRLEKEGLTEYTFLKRVILKALEDAH